MSICFPASLFLLIFSKHWVTGCCGRRSFRSWLKLCFHWCPSFCFWQFPRSLERRTADPKSALVFPLKVSGYMIFFITGGRWNGNKAAVCDEWACFAGSIWSKKSAMSLVGQIGSPTEHRAFVCCSLPDILPKVQHLRIQERFSQRNVCFYSSERLIKSCKTVLKNSWFICLSLK